MPWFEVGQFDKSLGDCVQCFKNVSKDSDPLTEELLAKRISKKINQGRPVPKLANGTSNDSEVEMFRVYRFHPEDPAGTLLTIALDRTLFRELDSDNKRTGRPRRNHWCITLGISDRCDLDLAATASAVLQLFTASGLIPLSYQLALLWHARKNTADLEIHNPGDWNILKHKADMVFTKLHNDRNIIYLQHSAAAAPTEDSYAHWKLLLGDGSQIRFVPIVVTQ